MRDYVCIGGGPAGLYFAILIKQAQPDCRVRVLERNQADDTFGFGVVFSDATLAGLGDADRATYDRIRESFAHWDDIDTHYGGTVVRSTGHGFSGLGRQDLLTILQQRCSELGVEMQFGVEVDPTTLEQTFPEADLIVAADGVNSAIRTHYAAQFRPDVDFRPNRFVWLGTTFPFEAFTFYFKENEHGLWRVHAYRYAEGKSTFIIECTADTFERSGLAVEDEDATIAYMQSLFAEELAGHALLKNRSIWRSFPVVRTECWRAGKVVLVGDAAHTAHFSIGSGTKIAMEDVIELAKAVASESDLETALARYEETRRPNINSVQRAAQVSLEWFEDTERYVGLEPLQFSATMLTRSLRVTHDNLKLRDPVLGERVEQWVAERAAAQTGRPVPMNPAPPPMFTPFKLRELVLDNRVVVSPMCQYSAVEGTVGDWHLVHLGSRAIGGAGLVIAEMTDVSAEGRISPGCAGLYAPAHVKAWKRVTDYVHRYSRAKIGVQLGHAGRKGSMQRLWEDPDQPLVEGNWPVMAASEIPFAPQYQTPRAMDREDMAQVVGEFAAAAAYADEAGFDLIELHAAHGYLLASFISPLTNRRTDAYGGDIRARMKFPLEVMAAVRGAWPAHKPISVRISATDWAPGGLTGAESVEVARQFAEAGADIIDVSAGQTVAEQRPVYGRLFQTPFADRIRHEAKVPTMTVGNISSYADVNSIIAAGRADLAVIARAHLHDPYFTHHAAHALGHPLEWPDQYKSIAKYKPRFE